MDWIVFGDDWGRHVSTTQHLVLNLPAEDRVVWLDSIGMRAPKLGDAKRVVGKLSSMMRGSSSGENQLYDGTVGEVRHIAPRVAPWHHRGLARAINRRMLKQAIAAETADFDDPVLLTVNPITVDYLDGIPHRRLAYLRLDRYAEYPGVDAKLVNRTEPQMLQRADVVAATARALLPRGGQGLYLPQGVRFEHFAQVRASPNATRIVGFYGLLSRYIDYGLVARVAKARPDWVFEFVGRTEVDVDALKRIPNVRVREPIPFAELPALLDTWQAAWAPYVLDEHTKASNPLKLREYLAAGLPSHCTPIPDATTVAGAFISDEPNAICDWLDDSTNDTDEDRARRREAMRGEDWSARAQTLRGALKD